MWAQYFKLKAQVYVLHLWYHLRSMDQNHITWCMLEKVWLTLQITSWCLWLCFHYWDLFTYSWVLKVEYMSQNLFSFVADGRWNTNHPGEKRNRKIYSQNVSCREKQKFKGAGSYNKVRFCTMSESFNKSSFGGMPCFYVLSFPGLYLWFLHMEAILDY